MGRMALFVKAYNFKITIYNITINFVDNENVKVFMQHNNMKKIEQLT